MCDIAFRSLDIFFYDSFLTYLHYFTDIPDIPENIKNLQSLQVADFSSNPIPRSVNYSYL